MAQLPLIKHPDLLLKEKSLPVGTVLAEHVQLAKDLYETMKANQGIGISAVQVGKLLRIIVMEVGNRKLFLFDPKILSLSKNKLSIKEGCLSFPGERIEIKRPNEVKVTYKDLNNKLRFSTFTGLEAICFLHEYDHLEGITFDVRSSQS